MFVTVVTVVTVCYRARGMPGCYTVDSNLLSSTCLCNYRNIRNYRNTERFHIRRSELFFPGPLPRRLIPRGADGDVAFLSM
jgi:hypothetical protein